LPGKGISSEGTVNAFPFSASRPYAKRRFLVKSKCR
jgi:hypothetical protein